MNSNNPNNMHPISWVALILAIIAFAALFPDTFIALCCGFGKDITLNLTADVIYDCFIQKHVQRFIRKNDSNCPAISANAPPPIPEIEHMPPEHFDEDNGNDLDHPMNENGRDT